MLDLSMLASFPVIEPQRLTGLTSGHVISQRPVAKDGVAMVSYGAGKFIPNGVICSLNNKGEIVNAIAGKDLFIHFDEERNRGNLELQDLASFAVKDSEGGCIRIFQLFAGDEFLTDNVKGEFVSGTLYGVKDGVIDASATDNKVFLYEGGTAFEETLPNGKAGYHFVVVK